MLSLDEAIKHAEAVADANERLCETVHPALQWSDYGKCAEEHRQLAEWLKELKNLREKDEPKAVRYEGDGYADGELVYDYGKCPKCGWDFEEGDKDWEQPYCCHCGQKLEWFDNKAESEE